MKKRIKQLAKDAGFIYDNLDCNFYSPEESQWINSEIYGFAEMIIEDCCNLVDEDSARKIREYFK